MARERILVVDDEEDILKLLDYNLTREGYKVSCVETGEAALIEAKKNLPDLILLDLMLPGVDGLDVCRILRADPATGRIPIVMLTAKGEETDIVTGLQLGADDYITKPFNPMVLLARVKAVLRRAGAPPVDGSDVVSAHGIVIDPRRHIVKVDGQPVSLTLTEFRILHTLARHLGWVFARYQIVEASQGDEADVTDRSVDVHIVSLRRKLGAAGDLIETVRGVGYRFKE